jgi:predicted type IV restriction endonuclease
MLARHFVRRKTMAVPKKVVERMISGLKRLIPVVLQQKTRDVSEADTVTLVKDLLSEVFGYDKYSELTGEFAIRGTYCDLAIRLEDKITQLVEVKAIGIGLEDRHVKQAVDYAANQGVEWVILTNAITWRLYHVIFGKPIDKRLLIEIDLTSVDPRKADQQELLYTFTKEGFLKGAHLEVRDQQDATNRFLLAALILNNEDVLGCIRRELRKVVDALVDESVIASVLQAEVIKRDALEGPAAEEATKRILKVTRQSKRDERPKTVRTEDVTGTAGAEAASQASDIEQRTGGSLDADAAQT